jgi:hypothetical protein
MKMRVQKNNNYTVMSNFHFRERNMSLKAKGLLSLMLSLPEDWDYTMEGLSAINKDGVDSVRTACIELETFGYLIRYQKKNNGKWGATEYVVFEEPQGRNVNDSPLKEGKIREIKEETKMDRNSESIENSGFSPSLENPITVKNDMEVPFTENPITVKPVTEKHRQSSTKDINKTKDINHIISYQSLSQDVKNQIGYDDLISSDNVNIDNLNEIVEIIVDVLTSTAQTIRVNKENKPVQIVKDRFKKLNEDHILDVIVKFQNYSKEIRNPKATIRTMLYNSLETNSHARTNSLVVNGYMN